LELLIRAARQSNYPEKMNQIFGKKFIFESTVRLKNKIIKSSKHRGSNKIK
jgi:hypothetical protein